ncbi:MAG TPA: histidine kinase, partial [Polyangiaceae bacterium]|nr:histidine kinase [Polyangiaceae bacterium]
FGALTGLFHGGLWAFAFVFPFVMEDARLRALESDRLRLEAETLRAQGELSRLRSQLEPHFLLNTLNAIAGLIGQEPREARRLLALLGELLSDSLVETGEAQTLGREMTWLRGYTAILEARFRGALTVAWDIEQRAEDVLVPHLLLQPLIENAVTHGALKRGEGGEVRVRARLATTDTRGPRLVCEIEDNGPGFEGAVRPGAIGLAAVRRRLSLWSAEARLTLESSERGSRAIVELPEREVA